MFDRREHARLVNFARLFVGTQDAEDVVQEFYLKLLSGKVSGFRHEAERRSWILQVIRYTALRWMDREQWRAAREYEYVRAQFPSLRVTKRHSVAAPPYELLLDVLSEVRRLVPEDQDILRIVLDIDADAPLVTTTLVLSPGQVRGRLYRARRRLKERLIYAA